MTNEEHIEQLKKLRSFHNGSYGRSINKAIEALEQEPVLDQIRAEIEQEYNRLSATRTDETLELGECLGLKMSLKIIGKYNSHPKRGTDMKEGD